MANRSLSTCTCPQCLAKGNEEKIIPKKIETTRMLGDELVKTSLICAMCYHTSIRQSVTLTRGLSIDLYSCLNSYTSFNTAPHKMVVISAIKSWSQVRMNDWLEAYTCPICYSKLRYLVVVHGILGEPVVVLVSCLKYHDTHALLRRPATKRFLRHLDSYTQFKYYEGKRKEYESRSSPMGFEIPSEEERQANDIMFQLSRHRDPLTDDERTDVKANLIKTLTQLKEKYAYKNKASKRKNNAFEESSYDRFL